MNELDFSFEDSPWETFLRTRRPGDTVSAANLLALLEGEEEQALEDALEELEREGMELTVSELPRAAGTGEAALRLRQEVQLVKKGLKPKELEPNDPLRLYLEEVAAMGVSGDEEVLAGRCARGDGKAMEALTELGLKRVIALASEHVGYGVLLMDLIQEDVSPEKIVRAVQVLGILQDLKTCCRKLRPHASRVSIRVDCLQLFIPALMAGRYDAAKNAGAAV